MDYFVGLEVSAHEMIADIAEETGRARADIKLELQLLEQQPETRHGGEPFLYVDVEIRNAPRSAKHSWRTPVHK